VNRLSQLSKTYYNVLFSCLVLPDKITCKASDAAENLQL